MADLNNSRMTGTNTTNTGTTGDWSTEDRYWRENFTNRPYAKADRGYEFYQPGYRYGYESAGRYGGRRFEEVENDLRTGWDRYEHRGENRSTWDEIKHAVKDGWNRLTGHDRELNDRGRTTYTS